VTKPDYVCPVSYPSSVGSLTAGEDKVMPTELLKRARLQSFATSKIPAFDFLYRLDAFLSPNQQRRSTGWQSWSIWATCTNL